MASETEMDLQAPRLPDDYTMCNCGKGSKCPRVRLTDGLVKLSDEDQIAGELTLELEEARQLRVWLEEHGF